MRAALLALTTALVASACTTPYDIAVGDYERGPQEPATIVISDPQVYSRETLVNDRRVEAEYLRGVLQGSETVAMPPQLRRQIETSQGISAGVSLLADPAAGDAFDRRRRALDAANDDGGEAPETPEDAELGDLEFDDVSGLPTTAGISSSPLETFLDRQGFRDVIRSYIADTNLDDGHDSAGNALYRLQFRATLLPGRRRGQFAAARFTFAPPALTEREIAELYLSWLAYVNREINRPSLAEQPTDTSVSSEEREQYIDDAYVAELELIGAHTNLFEVVALSTGSGAQISVAAPTDAATYLRAAACDAGTTFQPLERPESCTTQQELRPRADRVRAAMQRIAETSASWDRTARQTPDALPRRCLNSDLIDEIDGAVSALRDIQRPPTLALSLLVAGAQGGLFLQRNDADRRAFRRLIAHLRTDIAARQRLSADLAEAIEAARPAADCDRANELSDLTLELSTPAQSVFIENPGYLLGDTFETFRALIQDPRDAVRELSIDDTEAAAFGDIGYRPVPRGDLSTFFARPVDNSQRISSVMGAANALDLALAVRAQVGSGGVSGSAGANYVRRAAGRIDLMERNPIVVGFNDRRLSGACEDRSLLSFSMDCRSGNAARTLPQAGWIMGPPIVPESGGADLEHRHNVVNHAVSTDISVPGWWPRIEARLETAWIANWNGDAGGEIFRRPDDVSERTFSIELPHNAADMRALTRLVSGLGSPLTTPQILSVTPTSLRVCPTATSIRLQVSGRDLWQGSEAYLNGIQATTVRILPDMGGVDLTFPTANLPQLRHSGPGGTNTELVIWTRDSQVSRWITIERAAADSPFCVRENANAGGAPGDAPLTTTATWIAPGSEVRLQLANRSLTTAANEIRVQMRRFNPDTNAAFGAAVVLAADGGTPTNLSAENGVISFTVPAIPAAQMDDGALIEIAVVARPRLGGSETVIVAPRRLAYYHAPEQTGIAPAAITLPTGDTPLRLVVTLPRRAELRYPTLPAGDTPPAAERMSITGAVSHGAQTYQFASDGPWTFVGRNASGQATFATRVVLRGSDATAFWAALNASGAGGLTGQFSLSIDGRLAGAPVPITIKKQ